MACRISGPYLPVGDTDWVCREHGVIAELRDPSKVSTVLRREDFYCPVTERTGDGCRCRIVGVTRDPYEPHIAAQPEWEQVDGCPVHPNGEVTGVDPYGLAQSA